MLCEYGHGRCIAPNITCPHWIGTFCELDSSLDQLVYHYTPKARPKIIFFDESGSREEK